MMAIWELLNRRNNLDNEFESMSRRFYCAWRLRYVQALPEECVRMELLNRLVGSLGYPAMGIAVERELAAMPHLASCGPLPKRRADIVCYASGIDIKGECLPLLLIECKAVPLTRKMHDQVVGYNHYLKASFVALVNQSEARLGWFDSQKGRYEFTSGLPTYAQLLKAVSN
jgi:hypothetical protein